MINKKTIFSIIACFLMMSTFIVVTSEKIESISINILLNSKSIRNMSEKTIKIPMGDLYCNATESFDTDSRFLPLIATPVCCYWEGGNKNSAPLLIEDEEDPSRPVKRFIEQYNPDDVYEMPQGDVETISEDVATSFWNKSDIVLAIENSDSGYNQGLMATPIASYLNIPVIVGSPSSSLINSLECEYVILIGENIDIFSDTSYIRLVGREAIISYLLDLCKIKFNQVDYITLANPLDSKTINIQEENNLLTVQGADNAKIFGQVHAVEPKSLYSFEVPDGNQIVKFKLKFSPKNGEITQQESLTPNGEGFHLLFFDQDGGEFNATPLYNNGSLFYTDSNAYDDWEAYYEIDVNDNPGTYYVKLWAYGRVDKKWNLTISSEEIDSNIRPQAPYLSTLAPYLAVNHKGIVISDERFSENIAGKIGNIQRRYNVTLNEQAIGAANEDNKYTDSILDETLEEMKNNDLYSSYIKDSPYLGVIADNNMIPMYYYPSDVKRNFNTFEGTYQPSDNRLADINGDGYNLTTKLELAVGRLMGWDAQDVSALIARSIFYDKIKDSFEGLRGGSWEKSATMINGLAMQERLVIEPRMEYFKTNLMMRTNGYKVYSKTNMFYRVKNIEKAFENMQKSSLIWNEGHGRYYRYEYFYPLALTPLYSQIFVKLFYPQKQQSQYAVCNVKDMQMGPSITTICACIGGLNDGIPLRCTILMASLHAGCNAVFANTRCPNGALSNIGSILGALTKSECNFYYDELFYYWYENIVKDKNSVGMACRNAKNMFTEKFSQSATFEFLVKINPLEYNRACEDYVHYNLFGDPAFKK